MTTIFILLILIFFGFKVLKHINTGEKARTSPRRKTKKQKQEYKKILTFEELLEDEEKEGGGK